MMTDYNDADLGVRHTV